MQRHLFGTVVLISMSSALSAQPVSLSVVAGEHPGPYQQTLILNPSEAMAGSEIRIWTVIDSTIAIAGLEYRLHVNGGLDDAKFALTGYQPGPLTVLEPLLGVEEGVLSGYGEAFSVGGPPSFFGTTQYVDRKATLADISPAIPLDEVLTGETLYTPFASNQTNPISHKTLLGYVLEVTQDLNPGVYTISALGPLNGGPHAEYVVYTPEFLIGPILTGEDLTLLVTPEPATVLLLLAAMPFLYARRRSG